MDIRSNKWIRWTVTPLAAVAGFSLGCIAWRAVEGAISFLSFLPFIGMVLWIGPLISTYWSALWSIDFAVRCAPSNHMNVRWAILIVLLLLQMLGLGAVLGATPKQQAISWLSFAESACVVGWFFWQTWQEQMVEWRELKGG